MGLPRSTFYDGPATPADEAEIVARMRAICDEFESYGYRRVGAALRHQGIVVNSKRVRRLMRVHDLQPRRHRRFVATTDSDHDRLIFPDRAKGMVVDAPSRRRERTPAMSQPPRRTRRFRGRRTRPKTSVTPSTSSSTGPGPNG